MKQERKMWQFPWKYEESVLFIGGVVVVGFVLQCMTGPFDFSLLLWPVNGILGLVIVLLSIVFGMKRNNPLVRWFSGIPMAVTLIVALLILGIIMGLTPQVIRLHPGDKDAVSVLGLRQMTSAWPFVFLYFLILLSLGTLIARRLFTFNKTNYAFYLNHLGLWLLLFASGLGAADIKRYVMHVREGETEWRVYNDHGDILDLPIAIKLNDFIMEEYPPKLAIIDRSTGNVQPEEKPDYFQLEEEPVSGRIGDWDIIAEKYIHEAVRNSDSTYQKAPMPGASPAVKVKVTNRNTGVISHGWVCVGNSAQLYMTLPLDDNYTVVMTQPESKRFISDINIYTEDGKQTHALLEVNKPYRMGNWMVYQFGYDNEAGKLSSYSSMELVYDPWLIPVYIGITLLACGSICMLWIGNRRKEEINDVE